jgi:glycosyltransferase involved in cell wall biosynthesis
MRILYSGDSPTVDTGFGIVSRNILRRLVQAGHEITVLGVNHYGEPYDQREFPYQIYPCDKGGQEQIFGIHKLWFLENKTKPDIIFFLNDPWLIDQYIAARPAPDKLGNPHEKIIAYFPTDAGPLKPRWAETLTDKCDIQVCYSNFAERIVVEANGNKVPENLRQVYHGVDTSTFFPINQQTARERLGLPLDAFIVGMVARNQYRKRFDILMKAFADFAKDKPEAKLYLHTAQKDIGFDIADLSRQLGLADRLIMTEGMTPAHGVPDKQLNIIYNTFDINCLISLGDGFGLPVAESMATGCVQLVSDHSCLKELVEGHGGLTVKTAAWIMHTAGINTWGGVSDEGDLTAKLELLYRNKELRLKQSELGYNFIKQEKFTWDYAAGRFETIIKELFHIL